MDTTTTQTQEQPRIGASLAIQDDHLGRQLDSYTLEAISELKISRFLDQIGTNYPADMYELIMTKIEKPLVKEILKRTGGNQVQSARILGINRNTLRKKIKMHQLN